MVVRAAEMAVTVNKVSSIRRHNRYSSERFEFAMEFRRRFSWGHRGTCPIDVEALYAPQGPVLDPDLSTSEYPVRFVIGDAADSLSANGKSLPGLATVVQQQGRYVGRAISVS
jgi:hypothetical protein